MTQSPFYKLDVILNFIKNKQKPPKATIEEITKGVLSQINAHELEVLRIVNKLIKDELVDFDDRNINEVYPNSFGLPEAIVRYYYITFDGYFFLENPGGYARQAELNHAENTRLAKLENEAKEDRLLTSRLTTLIAFGTLIAAIYYSIEIYKELYQYFHRHNLFWIWETIPKK